MISAFFLVTFIVVILSLAYLAGGNGTGRWF